MPFFYFRTKIFNNLKIFFFFIINNWNRKYIFQYFIIFTRFFSAMLFKFEIFCWFAGSKFVTGESSSIFVWWLLSKITDKFFFHDFKTVCLNYQKETAEAVIMTAASTLPAINSVIAPLLILTLSAASNNKWIKEKEKRTQ